MKAKLIYKELRLAWLLIHKKNYYCAHKVLEAYPCKQFIINMLAYL